MTVIVCFNFSALHWIFAVTICFESASGFHIFLGMFLRDQTKPMDWEAGTKTWTMDPLKSCLNCCWSHCTPPRCTLRHNTNSFSANAHSCNSKTRLEGKDTQNISLRHDCKVSIKINEHGRICAEFPLDLWYCSFPNVGVRTEKPTEFKVKILQETIKWQHFSWQYFLKPWPQLNNCCGLRGTCCWTGRVTTQHRCCDGCVMIRCFPLPTTCLCWRSYLPTPWPRL